jgi:hypothetical protein
MSNEEETVYELSDETLTLLKKRRPKGGVGCFLCKLIVLDHEKNGSLTSYPSSHGGAGQFPVDAKLAHIKFERESAAVKADNAAEEKAAKSAKTAGSKSTEPKKGGPQV